MVKASSVPPIWRRLQTVAVTGTNGKTTTTTMVASIVAASGAPSARLTTLGGFVDGQRVQGATPTDEFKAVVERAVSAKVPVLALEMTSKALAGGLATRWPPHVAVFTNLTRDHLDMHGSAEAYLAAKAQLFMALAPGTTAVLNASDPASALIREVIGPDVRVVAVGRDLTLDEVQVVAEGTRVRFGGGALADELGTLLLPMHGAVHAANAASAALATHALGIPSNAIRRGLSDFAGVPGRFEIIARAPWVVVDYAHSPDALARTLESARALCSGALHCVFGCGGERDRGKRSAMGAVAHAGCDHVWLTSDNPRGEDPSEIAEAVARGARGPGARWVHELDRAAAISRAIAAARGSDAVVIAGKGHELEQEVRGVKHAFSDVVVARAALATR